MWYQVPPKPVEQPKPKPIFPWEGKAPKPTRVFAEPKLPSPPPEPVVEPEPEPEPAPSETTSATLDPDPAETPTMTSPDPWAGFQARTNAWDDIPEIERYMQALQGPRKAKIQVLHNTATPQSRQPQKADGRRQSLILTDFPTAMERPSLPVTPAPIRRPSFWGEERDEQGNLPAAEGVPKQEEWVRRFSSYPVPEFPASTITQTAATSLSSVSSRLHRTESGLLIVRCQYCGQQNPIAKLEELQRKQSEVLSAPEQLLEEPREVPERQMPESESKEQAIKAVESAKSAPATKAASQLSSLSPPSLSPEDVSPRGKMPAKPILKQPSFELPSKEAAAPDAPDVLSPTEVPSQVAAAAVEKVVPSADHVENPENRTAETVVSPPAGVTTAAEA